MMRDMMLVGIGGFIGSAARYGVGGLLTRATAASRFPFGTMTVNLVGCLVIGLLAGWIEQRNLLSAQARLFLMTGLLGGFTTFSAFAFETVFLAREQAWASAIVNVLVQVTVGLGLVYAGHMLASRLSG